MLQNKSMYITCVEKEGPFLKIWGQIDKKSSLEVEEALLRASEAFDQGQFIPKTNTLEVGLLYCAKYLDGKYYRARLTSISPINDGMVEVYFTDYGNKDVIPIGNLRSIECFNAWFVSLPPLSTAFILAEVVCAGGEWNDHIVEQISKEIRYMEHNYVIVAQAIRYYFIKVFIREIDLGLHLVRQNLMQSTSIQTQEAVLLAMIPRAVQSISPPNQSLLQYKSFTLEPNSQHEIYVSYITDGPSHFSVQLKKYESALAQLMREINSIPLKPLEELPIPGTVCLAKCVEDNHICRAVVTSEVDSQFKLFYVDFGNTELVPPENLYQIAFKFVIPKIMAIRLSLAGIEKTSITLDMQCAFKHFVDNRLLIMEVLPAAKKMALPKCRMWDPVSNIDVIDVLNRAAQSAYPNLIALHKGFTQLVKVSFVYSCNRFYVQIKSKEAELNQLMKDLQVYGNSNQTCYLSDVKIGQPCCALFSFDKNWYRCLVTEIEGNRAKIRYIDFGNEEFVPINSLKAVDGEYLTVLRPQAIECCLNGYQNMTEDQERDLKLEELILEQEFTMKVIDSIGSKTLIDLMDATNTTVTALLLESIMAQTKVQNISTHYETTKPEGSGKRQGLGEEWRGSDNRNDKQYFHHDDRMSPRVQNWKEKNGDNASWRQNSSNRKRSDSNSNESTGSWRQDNRGFKNRKENDWNDRTSNSSFKDKGFRNKQDNGEKERHQKNRNSDGNHWNNKRGYRNQNDGGAGNESRSYGRSPRYSNDERNASNLRADRSFKDNQGFNKKGDSESKDWGKTDNGDFKGRQKENNDWNNKSEKEERNKKTEKGNWNHKAERGDSNNKAAKGDWNNQTEEGHTRSEKNYRNNKNASSDSNNRNSKGGGDWSEKKSNKERNSDWNANKGGAEHTFGDRRDNNKGDFKKKSFRREVNEHNSSGSEKSFGRSSHNYSRNDNRPSRSDRKFGSKNSNDSWNTAAPPVVMDSARSDAKFKSIDLSDKPEKITISWFHNPCSFFCQLIENQESFKLLMEEIQQAYKGRPPGSSVKGAPVVALFPEDSVLYRATIMEVLGQQYKVHYVDFGNVSIVDKVWPIENKFMEMPMQAIPCGLTSLEPVGDNWPNPDNYSQYFEREDLNCVFSSCDESGRYWVNITVGNEDITQQLVNSALAKYSEPTTANVEISLLIGQQFRAMLQVVNSCADFSMILQSGFIIHCSLHNLATGTEINEDLLKQQLQQILIVYVDDLVENRLEVTLYDATGSKLNIIEPDEGAFDTVDLPCPYLVTSSTIHGFVSHVNEQTVVIQPSECSQTIQYLLEHFFEYYENLPPADDPLVPEEGWVYAVKSNDGNWYRGKVLTFNDDKVEVSYLDYGNSEEVEFSRLRDLNPEHLMWEALTVSVNVNIPGADFLEQDVIATVYYGESSWEGELQLASEQLFSPESQPEVEQIVESDGVMNLASTQNDENETVDGYEQQTPEKFESQVEDAIDVSQAPENSESSIPEKENIYPTGGTSVVLSHVDSPSDFYIQLVDSLSAIDELKARLQDAVGELTQLESVSVGGLCAAPYSLDQQWYRSQILDADDDITTVRFIDYGNTDVISNNTTHLKTLPSDLLTLEEYATRCRLKIKSSEEDWPKAAVERFEKLTATDNLTVEFIDQDEKTNYVELYSDGNNVKDILIAENLALLDDVVIEGKLTGFVSHINSPSEFWVQLESCCAELEWIAEQLSNAGSFQDLEDLTPGALCAAMFQDDEMWYRARILSNTVAGLEVLFLDYGNSCVCSNLKQLPEHLVMAPPLAQKCGLQKPEGVTTWNLEASQKFSELSADGQTIFTVKKLTTGETSIVELFMNGEEVSSKLLVYDSGVKESDSTLSSAQDLEDQGIFEKKSEQEIENVSNDIEDNKNNSEISVEDKIVETTIGTEVSELNSEKLESSKETAKEESQADNNLEDIGSIDCKISSTEKCEEEESKGNPQHSLSENIIRHDLIVRTLFEENNINSSLEKLSSHPLKENTPCDSDDTVEVKAENSHDENEKLNQNLIETAGNETNDEDIPSPVHNNTIEMIKSLVDNIVNGVHSDNSLESERKEIHSVQDEFYKTSNISGENIESHNLEFPYPICDNQVDGVMNIENKIDLLSTHEICEESIRGSTTASAISVLLDSSEELYCYNNELTNTDLKDEIEILDNLSTVTDKTLNDNERGNLSMGNDGDGSVSHQNVLGSDKRDFEAVDSSSNDNIIDTTIIDSSEVNNVIEETKIDLASKQVIAKLLSEEIIGSVLQNEQTETYTLNDSHASFGVENFISKKCDQNVVQAAEMFDAENSNGTTCDVSILTQSDNDEMSNENQFPSVSLLTDTIVALKDSITQKKPEYIEDGKISKISILNEGESLVLPETSIAETILSNGEENTSESSGIGFCEFKMGDQIIPVDKGYDEQSNEQTIVKQEHMACMESAIECQEVVEENHPISGCNQILESSKAADSTFNIISSSDSDKCRNDKSVSNLLEEDTSSVCLKIRKENDTSEVCSDFTESLSVSTVKSKGKETFTKIEFVDTILTSFSSPTVSERSEVAVKLSPTKILPKFQNDSVEKELNNSSSEENVIES